ncbi:hypothetical protein MKX01_017027 [Papaver californicum]|nr:hypothetical protein MKX01_017027 [Papaver californicum]
MQIIIEIKFQLPKQNQILLCCDGSSRGNPGKEGFVTIGRCHEGVFVYTVSGGLWITTNYIAEIMAGVNADEWVVKVGLTGNLISSDSKTSIKAF